ncbi:MAG: hypothetical protein ACLT76_01540 [Clostridium fessum]
MRIQTTSAPFMSDSVGLGEDHPVKKIVPVRHWNPIPLRSVYKAPKVTEDYKWHANVEYIGRYLPEDNHICDDPELEDMCRIATPKELPVQDCEAAAGASIY